MEILRRKSVICSVLLIAPLLLYYGHYNVVEMRVDLGDKDVYNKKASENDEITTTSSSHSSSANGAGNIETKTVLPTPPDLSQLDCPRFAFMRFTKNGLGQKLSELVFGLNLAKQTNSNYVLHTELLTQNGKHGNYSWILDMLPLHQHYVTRKPYFEWKETLNDPIRTIGGQWNSIVDQSNHVDCNVAFSANFFACCDDDETQPKMECPKDVHRTFPVKVDETTTSKKDCQWVAKNSKERCGMKTRSGKELRDLCKETCDNCPKSRRTDATCYCTQSVSQIGTFEEQKDLLRGIWKESTYKPPHELSYYLPPGNNPMVSIVWHVRVGDLVLHNDKEYFGTIASQIVESFRSVVSDSSTSLLPYVFVMGEGGKDAILKHFDFWPELCYQYFDDRCVYPDLNAQETFYHMVQSADILVTTGSSFPAGAAMLRSHGITLATMPKEGLRGVYGVSENIDIDKDGTIPELGKVTAFLETLLNPQ